MHIKDVENNDEIKVHFPEIEDFVKGLRYGLKSYCNFIEKSNFAYKKDYIYSFPFGIYINQFLKLERNESS